jgi:hypothetical protein
MIESDDDDEQFPDVQPEEKFDTSGLPVWVPEDLADWLRKVGGKAPENIKGWRPLVIDDRMRTVWDWYSQAKAHASHSVFGTSLSLCMSVERAMRLPGKPGNMTAAKRAEYFEKVRLHADALMTLLEGTIYSANSAISRGKEYEEIDSDRLAEIVVRDLADWGDDEIGHVVAYYVDEDGVSRMPWHYPESELLDVLHEVIAWTASEDYWDWGIKSSKPLAYAREPNRRIVFFTCTLFEDLARHGIAIPFPQLATVTNVALQLRVEDQVDEEVVRKQVRRHQLRMSAADASAEIPF